MPSTAVYRALVEVIEGRRVELGLSMATVNDLSGVPEGYYAKMIYPDTPSGRQARWEQVQDVVEALFGRGFTVQIVAGEDENRRLSTAPLKDPKITQNALQVRHWRNTKHFKVLGKKGGEARAALPKDKLRRICRKAAKTRWKRIKAAERAARKHHEENAKKGKVRHLQPAPAADGGRNSADV